MTAGQHKCIHLLLVAFVLVLECVHCCNNVLLLFNLLIYNLHLRKMLSGNFLSILSLFSTPPFFLFFARHFTPFVSVLYFPILSFLYSLSFFPHAPPFFSICPLMCPLFLPYFQGQGLSISYAKENSHEQRLYSDLCICVLWECVHYTQ